MKRAARSETALGRFDLSLSSSLRSTLIILLLPLILARGIFLSSGLQAQEVIIPPYDGEFSRNRSIALFNGSLLPTNSLIRIGTFTSGGTNSSELSAFVNSWTNQTSTTNFLDFLNTNFVSWNSFGSANSPWPGTASVSVANTNTPAFASSNLVGKPMYLWAFSTPTNDSSAQMLILRSWLPEGFPDPEAGLNSLFSLLPSGTNAVTYLNPDGDEVTEYGVSVLFGQYFSDSLEFRLSGVNPSNEITSATTKPMNAGSSSTYQILSNNGATSFSATPLPAWASLNSVTGVITLAPGASVSGTFTLGLSAINSLTGTTATGSLDVTVQAASGPTFTSSATSTATAGVAFSYPITTDAPSTFTATSLLPSGLSLDSATGVLSGIPRSATTSRITIRAARTANAESFTDQDLTLTVSSPTLAIVALVSGQLTRTAGTIYEIPVTIPAGFTVDSGSVAPTISGVTYSAGNLLISSTAAPFAKGITSQAVTLTLNRTSGLDGATVSASLGFNLRLVAPAPIALTTAGPFEVNVGEDYTLQLSTDVSTLCPNQNIQIVGTLPSGLINARLGGRDTGLISGKNASTTAPSEFKVDIVADTSSFYEGGGTLTVEDVTFRLRNPVAPVITSTLTRFVGVGMTFARYTIVADGAPSRFAANGLPPGIVLNGAVLTGTPSQAGDYTVSLEAENYYRPGLPSSPLQKGSANLQIRVQASKPSTATSLSGSSNLQVGNAASFSMLGAQQLGLWISGYGFPPGLTINPKTGLVTGTPTAAGTYSVTVFIQNGKGWIKKTVPLTVR